MAGWTLPAFLTLFTGLLTTGGFTLGFSLPYWVWIRNDLEESWAGIWLWCYADRQESFCMKQTIWRNPDLAAWVIKVQTMECLSLISAVIAIITSVLWIALGYNKAQCTAICISFLLACVFGIVGVILYSSHKLEFEHLHVAFGLTCACSALHILPAIIAGIASHRGAGEYNVM